MPKTNTSIFETNTVNNCCAFERAHPKNGVHIKPGSITHVATKVQVMLRSFVVLTWMRDIVELVQHVTLWNLNLFSSHLIWPS